MDPNVSIYHNRGSQFRYDLHSQTPSENHAAFIGHYISDSTIVDPFENRNIDHTVDTNSRNLQESVIKNYKHLENRPNRHTVQNGVPEVSNTYNLPMNQHYGQITANRPLFSSVIQSTNQYATHYQNAEYQERNKIQYIPNNIQKWDKSSNYFCKKLPDFSNVNMEMPSSSKYIHFLLFSVFK